MKNLKHSIVAMIAIAMISSLAAVQAATINNNKQNTEKKINSANEMANLTIAQVASNDETAVAIAESVQATATENDKSYYQLGYVMLTSGTLEVKEMPSYEAAAVGELNACDQVEILEYSEGWYKIHCGDVVGYAPESSITICREDADYAAMHYNNYKKATVLAENGVIIRKEASSDAESLDELEAGTEVTVLWSEGDFIRIAYGDDYDEGYVIDTSLELTGDWIPKSSVSEKQEEVAAREAAEAQAAAEAAAAEARQAEAAEAAAIQSGNISPVTSSSSSSATGQAIVNKAMQYLGVPYVWGGTSPSGFDCSGLVQYVMNSLGIDIARVAEDQRNCGTYVTRDNLEPGDLVFFSNGSNIHHVGIYIGDGNMIHAPQTGDVVKISSINTDYRISQYAGAVRMY